MSTGKHRGVTHRRSSSVQKMLYILPFMVLLFAFSYYPIYGWLYAFFDYKPPRSLFKCEFVGFKWFSSLFATSVKRRQLWQVMKNTFAMSLLGIATSWMPMIFAVFLNEIGCKPVKKLIQTFVTIPNFVSWILVYSIAFSLFSSSGMINTLLVNLGWVKAPIMFLDSPDHTYLKMLLWSLWKSLGWSSIMYLAAITGIDQEMVEAAKVDGASRMKIIRHITIPSLLPTYFVLLVLSIANFLNSGMEQYFVFQNSFNKETIQVLDLYVYNLGLAGGAYSLSTAISMMKSIISVTLLLLVNRLSKAFRGNSIF